VARAALLAAAALTLGACAPRTLLLPAPANVTLDRALALVGAPGRTWLVSTFDLAGDSVAEPVRTGPAVRVGEVFVQSLPEFGELRVLEGLTPVRTLPLGATPTALAWRGDDLLVATSEGDLLLVDPQGGQVRGAMRLPAALVALAWPLPALAAVLTSAGDLVAVNPFTATRETRRAGVTALAAGGERVVTAAGARLEIRNAQLAVRNELSLDADPELLLVDPDGAAAYAVAGAWITRIDLAAGLVLDTVQLSEPVIAGAALADRLIVVTKSGRLLLLDAIGLRILASREADQ
jgi:hypothetical protein